MKKNENGMEVPEQAADLYLVEEEGGEAEEEKINLLVLLLMCVLTACIKWIMWMKVTFMELCYKVSKNILSSVPQRHCA
jgi:hypothetical protein